MEGRDSLTKNEIMHLADAGSLARPGAVFGEALAHAAAGAAVTGLSIAALRRLWKAKGVHVSRTAEAWSTR